MQIWGAKTINISCGNFTRQSRQHRNRHNAVPVLSAVLYKRPGILGDFTKGTLFGRIASIAAFMAFTAFNWRCPACSKIWVRSTAVHAKMRYTAAISIKVNAGYFTEIPGSTSMPPQAAAP
jgi:hypothetical protein